MASRATHSKSRADLRRRTKRRRIMSLIMLGICVLSAPFWSRGLLSLLAETTITKWPGCELRTVQYSGLSYLSADSILTVVEFPYNESLFEIDYARLEARIRSHPWIASVVLHRRMPDCLEVAVVEHVPVATIRSNDVYALSATGNVLSVPTSEWVWNLPMITPPKPLELWPGDVIEDACTRTLLNQVVTVKKVTPALWSNLSELYYHENEIRATLLSPRVILKLRETSEQRSWLALEQLIKGDELRSAKPAAVTIIDLRIPGSLIVNSSDTKKPSQESNDA